MFHCVKSSLSHQDQHSTAWPAKIVTHSTTLRPRQLSHSQNICVTNKLLTTISSTKWIQCPTLGKRKIMGNHHLQKKPLSVPSMVFQHIPHFLSQKNKTLLGLHSSGRRPPSQSTTRTSSWSTFHFTCSIQKSIPHHTLKHVVYISLPCFA